VQSSHSQRPVLALAAVCAAALALLPAPLRADNICFDPLGAPALPGPPAVPGDQNDPHWSTVYRFDYNNGTPSQSGTLQAGSSGGLLYLQWTINNATNFSNSDRVSFAFQDSAGRFFLLTINPNCDGLGVTQMCNGGVPACGGAAACSNNQPSFQPAFSQGTYSGSTWTWTPVNLPSPMAFGAGSSGPGAGGGNSWFVQLKMPASYTGISPGDPTYSINGTPGSWKVYTNAYHVDDAAIPPTVTELTWPNNAGNLVYVNADKDIPPVTSWGSATLGSAGCVGMHLTSLHTDGTLSGTPSPTVINYDRHTKLMADYANTGAVAGSCVRAQFRLANFGLSSAWQSIAAANNPTSPPLAITPGATGTFTADWDVPHDPNVDLYNPTKPGSHPHQCLRVDLFVDTSSCTPSGAGNTFDTATMFQNMDFGHSSVFTREPAEIRGDVVKPLVPGGKNRLDLKQFSSAELSASGVRLTALFHATRRTGKSVDIPQARERSACNPGCREGTLCVSYGPATDRSSSCRVANTIKCGIANDGIACPPGGVCNNGACKVVPAAVKTFEVAEPLPSFGYVVEHVIDAAERTRFQAATPSDRQAAWSITMGGLKQVRSVGAVTTYALELAENEVASATPSIEYVGIGNGGNGTCNLGCLCSCFQLKKTPAAAPVSGFMLMAVGFLAFRRPKRK
jgi:hypothetical protein